MFYYFSEEIQVLRSQVQETKSLCQAAEVERDRLLELVTLLQRRWDSWVNQRDEEGGEVGGGIVRYEGAIGQSNILLSLRARLEFLKYFANWPIETHGVFSKPRVFLFLSIEIVYCSLVYMYSVYRSLDRFVSCVHVEKHRSLYTHFQSWWS